MFNRTELQTLLDLDLADALLNECHDSIASFRAQTLKSTLFKKFKDESSDEADAAAISLFHEMNAHCREVTIDLTDETLRNVVDYVRMDWWRYFSPDSWECVDYSWDTLYLEGGLGPGANRGAKSYNFYTKMYDSDLTSTNERLHRLFTMSASRYSKSAYNAEIMRAARYGNGLVQGNKLTTVNKNVNISRCICTEPTLNMYYQKGLGSVIEKVLLSKHNIALDRQPDINREMARQGSKDGVFCTIDLRSASDTISLKLLNLITPRRFLNLLQLLRSPHSRIGDEEFELHMVSTMGNGFTFPLQTLLFATVVTAVYREMGIKPNCTDIGRNYSVFGDDIIVVNDAYNKVVDTLEGLGFLVNRDKSFGSGNFRESCGGDFLHGYNVRGFYIKSLKTQQNVNAAYNGLLLWQLRTGIRLQRCTSFLLKFKRNWVPLYEDPSAGYYATRKQLPSGTYVRSVVVPKKFKPERLPYAFKSNADGLLQTFLGGYIRDGRITLRSDVNRYRYEDAHTDNPVCEVRIKMVHQDFCPTWVTMLDYAL